MAAAWPDRAGSDPFADRMNAITKYVVSSTLGAADLTWENSHRLPAGELLESVAALKADPGGALLVMGSTKLATALLSAGLVDELLLMIEPVLLGGGKSIFPADGEMRALELVSVQTTHGGVLVCTYRPGGIPPTPDFEEI